MTSQNNQIASRFAACGRCEALKARFMANPRAALVEHGVDVPTGSM